MLYITPNHYILYYMSSLLHSVCQGTTGSLGYVLQAWKIPGVFAFGM